jgi:hypothetical protein
VKVLEISRVAQVLFALEFWLSLDTIVTALLQCSSFTCHTKPRAFNAIKVLEGEINLSSRATK